MSLPAAPALARGSTLAALALVSALGTGCKGCKSETSVVTAKRDTGTTEPDPFVNDWGQWLSLDLMGDGSPALAYYDNTRGALGFAVGTVVDGDVRWEHEEVDGYVNEDGLDVGDRGKYASMAVTAEDEVWIAYYDVGNNSLRYALRGADGTWTSGLADSGSGAAPDAGLFASLALDSSGAPVIAHHDEGKGTLRVVRWKGAAFEGETVDEGEDVPAADTGEELVAADVGEFASVHVEDDGTTWVAYYDRAAGDLKLAWGTEGSWEIEVVDSTGDVGHWPSIAIDGDTVYIAYQDVGEQDLKLASGSPGSWGIQVVDDGTLIGADTAVFLADGEPSIVYFDGYSNDMKRATRSGGAWELYTVTGDEGAQGFHNEVVVGSDGTAWAACYDYTQRSVWFGSLD